MTKKDWFEVLKAMVEKSNYADKAGATAFIDHEVELLNKKSSKSKETKTKKTHSAILDAIKAVLTDQTKPVTITEMMTDARLASYEEEGKNGSVTVVMTNQKLSSMVKKLVDAGEIVRAEEKKKAYFSLPKAEGKSTEDGENKTENE